MRHLWWAIPIGCFGLIAASLLFVGAILTLVFSILKGSVAYENALEVAAGHPAVLEVTGEPVEAGWFVSGNINTNNQTGRADLSIPISGPDGSGYIQVEATKNGGEWYFDRLVFLDADGGPPIELLDE